MHIGRQRAGRKIKGRGKSKFYIRIKNMRIAENWKDYKIIDTSSGDKLESWGGKVLVRPDPQIIWKSPKRSDL